jgi:hypothetical protein
MWPGNKDDFLKNLYTCLIPVDEEGTATMYEAKGGKLEYKGQARYTEEYEVYLVNNSEYSIERVEKLVGGFVSTEDGVVSTKTVKRDLGKLDSKAALLVETLGIELLDFMNWYRLTLHLSDVHWLKIGFEFKYYNPYKEQEIPILKRIGNNLIFDVMEDHLRE